MPEPQKTMTRYDGPRTTDELKTYAQMIAFDVNPEGAYKANNALPVAFRGNPGAVAFAVEYGKALDVSPITALIGIHIVDGKPTASAGLISALVRRRGHKIRTWLEGSIEEGNAKGITTIHRDDDPEFEYRSEWTLPRAVRAGLMKQTPDGRFVSAKDRSAWATYPENMLKSRSITECARDAAEDAILGVHYTPEELGAEIDPETGDVVYSVTQVPPTPANAPQTPPGAAQGASRATTAPTATHAQAGSQDGGVTELDLLADDARRLVLKARTLEDLGEVWKGEQINSTTARAEQLVTRDLDGVECTILDLFRLASDAIKAGAPLVPDDQLDDGDDGDDDSGISCGTCGHPEDDCQCPPDEPSPAAAPAPNPGGNVGDLATVLDRLEGENRQAVGDALAWAEREGYPVADGVLAFDELDEQAAARFLDALASGEAYEDTTIRETFSETPEELLGRILGATVIEERPSTATEAAAAAREEDRADARAATPANRGAQPQRNAAGAAAARAAIKKTPKS